jgi:hypothetical protein
MNISPEKIGYKIFGDEEIERKIRNWHWEALRKCTRSNRRITDKNKLVALDIGKISRRNKKPS